MATSASSDSRWVTKSHSSSIRHDICIIGDEVGGNLCMKGDGHVDGSLFG